MSTLERMYTVDDVWRLEQESRHPTEKHYLIDRELHIKMSPNQIRGETGYLIVQYPTGFALKRGLDRDTRSRLASAGRSRHGPDIGCGI